MGGLHFLDDGAFVSRGEQDVAVLADHGLTEHARVLDWGCGAGRLAVGLLETWPDYGGSYLGVDVQRDLIAWASRHLTSRNPRVRFVRVDAANARYNRAGRAEHAIPCESGSIDVCYGYSVLSHMTGAEVSAYLKEIRRILAPGGFAWVTAFIEDDVPPEEENPQGYGPFDWSGPLHCVRYESGAFAGMVADAGLSMTPQEHGAETDGQTALVLRAS